MEGAERQARELRDWRAAKEQELAELHEMVEAGQVCVCVCVCVCVLLSVAVASET
jgi:hypothetical protein